MKVYPNKKVAYHTPASHGGVYSIKNPDPDLVDFSSNINPLGCYHGVKSYLKKQVKAISVYPDSDSRQLRGHLSWYTGVPKSQIVVGNGATEIIYNFGQAFLNENTDVLIPIPTFSEYESVARLAGSNISFFRTMNFNKVLDRFIQKIPKKGCVFLCNPNNPTGVLVPRKKMLKIVEVADNRSTIVFVDECFIELVPQSNESLAKDLKQHDNLFILRSLTKSFGLAGIRIGYGLGSKQLITPLQKIKTPWNVSGFAQSAASAALCYRTHLEKTRKLIRKEFKFLKNAISNSTKFSCYDSAANFILIKSKTKKSRVIQRKLLKKKILVRDCSTFRGLDDGNFIRVAVRTRKENLKLVKALEEI